MSLSVFLVLLFLEKKEHSNIDGFIDNSFHLILLGFCSNKWIALGLYDNQLHLILSGFCSNLNEPQKSSTNLNEPQKSYWCSWFKCS